jgi:trehalose-6-phosphate synthase
LAYKILIGNLFGCLNDQVMLGVDRLDMIKGIPQKLLAFEKFLEENPTWRDRVLLVQIAVPTRTDVHDCMFVYPIFTHSDER